MSRCFHPHTPRHTRTHAITCTRTCLRAHTHRQTYISDIHWLIHAVFHNTYLHSYIDGYIHVHTFTLACAYMHVCFTPVQYLHVITLIKPFCRRYLSKQQRHRKCRFCFRTLNSPSLKYQIPVGHNRFLIRYGMSSKLSSCTCPKPKTGSPDVYMARFPELLTLRLCQTCPVQPSPVPPHPHPQHCPTGNKTCEVITKINTTCQDGGS